MNAPQVDNETSDTYVYIPIHSVQVFIQLECLNAIVVAYTVIVTTAAADVVVVTTWQLHNLIWFYSFKLPVALSSLARSMRHAVTLKSLTQSSSQVKPRQNEIQSFIVIASSCMGWLSFN